MKNVNIHICIHIGRVKNPKDQNLVVILEWGEGGGSSRGCELSTSYISVMFKFSQ